MGESIGRRIGVEEAGSGSGMGRDRRWPEGQENEWKSAVGKSVGVGGISRMCQRLGMGEAPRNQYG